MGPLRTEAAGKPATAAIERLEAEFGVPVLTQFNPILYQALNALGHAEPVEGFGRLPAGRTGG